MSRSESPPENAPPLAVARARARAMQRTTELRSARTVRTSKLRLALVGLACAGAGFGIGMAVTGDEPIENAEKTLPTAPITSPPQVDPSTFPAGSSEPTTTTTTGDRP